MNNSLTFKNLLDFHDSSLSRVDEILALSKLRSLICAFKFASSRGWRKFVHLILLLQGFALISPLEGFSPGAIEVVDELKDAGFELCFADEISSVFPLLAE